MTLTPLHTEQCIYQLQNYARAEVRSWNPFNLFKKRKQKNHHLAADLAKVVQQQPLSDNDLIKIASAIEHFEDSKLQHNLLCFLYTTITSERT
ncbi:MAG: hypothetical protein PSV35_05220, partial [bacterium]|nr:hypothetical protein [bacterium]